MPGLSRIVLTYPNGYCIMLFMLKNTKQSITARIDTTGTCHIWTGLIDPSCGGYGKVNFEDKEWLVHRLVAHWAGMDIQNKVVMHSCDNPACCNILHLSTGTPKDNSDDKISKRRHRHMFTDEEVLFLRTASTHDIQQRFNLTPQTARHARWRSRHFYKHVF